jgi:amino acid adenylation domain-containing protein
MQQSVSDRMTYWRDQFVGKLPVPQLYSERSRPSLSGTWGALPVAFSNDLTEALRALSYREGVTLFVTLLGTFSVLLYRYTGQKDILVGSLTSPRRGVAIQDSNTCFLNVIPLRVNLSGNPSFRELLERLRDATVGAFSHEVPFEHLLRELKATHDFSHTSMFQAMFSLLPQIPVDDLECNAISMHSNGTTPEHDLHLKLHDGPEGLVGHIAYNADIFESSAIARMLGHSQILIEAILAAPEQRIGQLPILTVAERYQLLTAWNNTKADYPTKTCLHEMIEAQVERTPEAVAIVHEGRELSYQLLNERANQLAQFLRKFGVGPDTLVGVCVERSPELIVALLGILKSGGAYVPLDPQYPAGRLSMMVEDSGLRVMVTQEPFRSKFSQYQGQLVCLDRQSESISLESPKNRSGGAKAENLAYVIYTSGSTGKPKGVQISHRSLVNLLFSMQSSPGLTAEDTLLAVTTVAFDIAALELYLPLTVGARVILATRETAADGSRLRELLEKSVPTVMQATPATWRLLLEAGWQGHKDLKVLCGGEVMPRDLAVELLKIVRSVWNMYGPTETTVWSTTCQVTSGNGPIAIGRPIANTEIYILDSCREPVPVGVPGELYIGGDGVARGYLNRQNLTVEKFIPSPFGPEDCGGRLYRTGDLARYRANGDIECLGRIDNQVKVRGFRIELQEIESVLSEYKGVRQNVVIAREDASGDKRLVAYVAVGRGQSPAAEALREFLKQKLPDYMLPSRFIFLDNLPLTPNGKLDRRALPMPEQLESNQQKGYVAARNDIEFRLLKIWESILSIRITSVKENFFELGGHSLLVAKLLRRIEHAFGRKLSMAAIFEAPTVEQQASILSGSILPRSSAVIPIQPAGFRPPFFCFGFGAGPVFLPLARRLGHHQPLLGVDPTLLNPSQLPVPCNMEDIATCLAKQIRELHPDGPYYLGGLCGGGLMAYATASQLMAQGHRVALLALFEPHTGWNDYYVGHANGFRPDWLRRRIKFHLGNLLRMETKDAPAYIRDHIRERAKVYVRNLNRLFRNSLIDMPRMPSARLRNILDTLDLACRRYHPQPLAVQVTLFQATHREPGGDWERQYWAGLATTLEIHEIPGYSNWLVHFFLEPNVDILAKRLKVYLPETQSQAEVQDHG